MDPENGNQVCSQYRLCAERWISRQGRIGVVIFGVGERGRRSWELSGRLVCAWNTNVRGIGGGSGREKKSRSGCKVIGRRERERILSQKALPDTLLLPERLSSILHPALLAAFSQSFFPHLQSRPQSSRGGRRCGGCGGREEGGRGSFFRAIWGQSSAFLCSQGPDREVPSPSSTLPPLSSSLSRSCVKRSPSLLRPSAGEEPKSEAQRHPD